MPTTEFEAVLTTIANAIRAKTASLGTALIPVTDFADRIKLIPRADDVRKVVVYATEQTAAQMITNKLVRLNGLPAFDTPVGGTAGAQRAIDDAFRREEWQGVEYPPTWDTLTSACYREMLKVGDKIYMGFAISGAGSSTSLPVINTRTGAVSRITGLASGQYSGLKLIGTKLYLFRGRHIGTIPSYNQIYCIDTADDSYVTITLGASRQYVNCALVGNRLYFCWEGSTAATDIPYINTSDNTVGMTTGLVSRVQHGLFSTGNKLFIAGNAVSTSINVITGSGGTAPNYTTWTVSNIADLPSRIWSSMWSNAAYWIRAGNYLYVASSEAATSILKIDHSVAANTTTQITDLANVGHRPMHLVGTKLYLGSSTATTQMTVITNATSAAHSVKQITGLPNRSITGFYTVGTKLYLGSGTSGSTLVIVNTSNDSFSEAVGTGFGATIATFVLDGTNLYLLSGASFTTSQSVVNTTNDTLRARITGLASSSWKFLTLAPNSRSNPAGGIYIGTSNQTAICEIDFETVNERPSGASIAVREISGLPNRSYSGPGSGLGSNPEASCTIFANEKIWLGDSGNDRNSLVVLTKSLLPTHVNSQAANNVAPFVYIRY